MAISKIILNGVTQIDLTSDTVAASNLISPHTAHGADGNQVTGTATGGISGTFMIPIEQNNDGIFVPTITDFSEVAAAQEEQHLILYAYNLAGAVFAYASYYENYEGYSECVTYGYTIYFSDYDTGGDSRNYGMASVYVTYGYYNGALKTDYAVYKDAYNTSEATATADKILSGYTAFGPNGIIDGTAEAGGATIPTYGTKTITENGTYAAEDDNYDGYSEVTVNVAGSSGWDADDVAYKPTGITGDITLTVSYISNYAFAESGITSVNAPNLTSGGAGYYFHNCTSLKSASLPKFAEQSTTRGANIFAGCSNLETVDAPLIRLNVGQFDGCSKLKRYVNKQTAQYNMAAYMFRNCSSLEALDLNKIGQFGASYAWNNTTSLSTIILRRSDAIVPLNSTSNVPNSMKSGGIGCTVYVPSALVSTYETATNWSTLVAGGNLTFAAIEGSQYENYYADGTAIS